MSNLYEKFFLYTVMRFLIEFRTEANIFFAEDVLAVIVVELIVS